MCSGSGAVSVSAFGLGLGFKAVNGQLLDQTVSWTLHDSAAAARMDATQRAQSICSPTIEQ
ncbi:hypothetical protein CGLO_14404 [Colletotrichum gloeosporioides Cg-14]|uniref:Uncharacterized protein n=1 Tax=Colletotrichum gloeosporioides (strain Cg-14) TaxID=1237896 RepID=T0L4R5_COLGC|nr:hypothetical protein CGLO_14404 [Colletotrichum gloeosporioides Cg-14]